MAELGGLLAQSHFVYPSKRLVGRARGLCLYLAECYRGDNEPGFVALVRTGLSLSLRRRPLAPKAVLQKADYVVPTVIAQFHNFSLTRDTADPNS